MAQKRVVTPAEFPWLDLRRYAFSLGVEKGGFLFLSGASASEYDRASDRVVCRGDVGQQCHTAFEKLGRVLRAAGMGFEHVVKTVDYITPKALAGYRATAPVRREFFQGNWSAATGIIVESLLRPDALIEIEAIAVREPAKKPIPLPEPRWQELTYFPGVRTGDYIWVSGFTGRLPDPSGRGTYPPDVASQARQAYEHLRRVLQAGGASPQDVVKTMDYLAPAGLDNYRGTRQVREDFFQGSYPAATGIVMNRLLRPEALLEIDLVAAVGAGRREVMPSGWQAHYGRLTYRPAVGKGPLLFLAGQGAIDHETGNLVGEGDVVAQTKYIYESIATALKAAGGSLADVVKTTEFITPQALPRYRETAALRRGLFRESLPAATGVVVNRLLRPGMLIEVDAIAVLG